MRKSLAIVTLAGLFGITAIARPARQQAQPASMTSTSIEEVLKAVREDLQGQRADIMAKNLTLTSAEASKFWPVFEKYQKEQNAVMDEQMSGIQRYIESFDKLDDAGALALVNTHLDKDAKMAALRRQWLAEFQKVIGAKQAARVIQIDRRLSLEQQIVYTTKIPLIH